MPHDGPNEPSWLDQRPNLKRMAWIAFGIGCLFALRELMGQQWMLDMFEPGYIKDTLRTLTGASASTVNGG